MTTQFSLPPPNQFRPKTEPVEAIQVAEALKLIKQSWCLLPQWFQDHYEAGNLLIALNEIQILKSQVVKAYLTDWIVHDRYQDLRALTLSEFEAQYRKSLAPVVRLKRPLTLCTIYNGALPDPHQAPLARIALMLFNDVIVRVAFELDASLVDLRLVCSEASDYANPIEPSGQGGLKIARAIARAAGAISGDAGTRVFR